MKWQSYLRHGRLGHAPFLAARVASPSDPERTPLYVDALIDTGSGKSGIPAATVQQYRDMGVLVPRWRDVRARGAYDSEYAPRPRFLLELTLCASPGSTGSLAQEELDRWFATSEPLFSSHEHGMNVAGEQMPVVPMVQTASDYALVGRDVLCGWISILHGPRESFRLLRRGGKWFIFSSGPGGRSRRQLPCSR